MQEIPIRVHQMESRMTTAIESRILGQQHALCASLLLRRVFI